MKRDDDDVVRVYAGPLVLVEVYKAALADEGIEGRVVGTELAASFGSTLAGSTELWVNRSDLARAEELIAQEMKKETPHA
jgi:hypothetical protein